MQDGSFREATSSLAGRMAAIAPSCDGVRCSGVTTSPLKRAPRDTMTHLSASAAREELAETVNRVAYGGERVVIERRGKAVAAENKNAWIATPTPRNPMIRKPRSCRKRVSTPSWVDRA